jgi:hypothetical protein
LSTGQTGFVKSNAAYVLTISSFSASPEYYSETFHGVFYLVELLGQYSVYRDLSKNLLTWMATTFR